MRSSPSSRPVHDPRRHNPEEQTLPPLTIALTFSQDGRRFAYTDRGPGPDGLETEQIFTIDLRTGERHQVTRLARTTPPPSPERTVNGVRFASSDTISFLHYRPEGAERLAVRIDGTGLRPRPVPAELGNGVGGRVVPTFGISNARLDIVHLAIPGVPENAAYLPTYAIREVFRVVGRNLIQLTNFRRVETQWVGARPRDVLFLASGDPLRTNRLRNCQLFRVSPYGGGLRQLTRFGQGFPSEEGCQLSERSGCGIAHVVHEGSARDYVFYSDCDPFGTNPNGSQAFAIGWDGSRLRQLTHTTGLRTAADGSLEVEIPGPLARGGGSLAVDASPPGQGEP